MKAARPINEIVEVRTGPTAHRHFQRDSTEIALQIATAERDDYRLRATVAQEEATTLYETMRERTQERRFDDYVTLRDAHAAKDVEAARLAGIASKANFRVSSLEAQLTEIGHIENRMNATRVA